MNCIRLFLGLGVLLALGLSLLLEPSSQGVQAQEVRKPRKVALLVGPKTYLHDFKPLKYLDKDVEAIGDELKKGGFDEVVILTGGHDDKNAATKENIFKELKRLLEGNADKKLNIQKDDVVMLVFSGHGQEVFIGDKKSTYFAPADGKQSKPDTLVDMSEVMSIVSACGSRNVVLADMCRDIYNPNKGKGFDIDNLKVPTSSSILFACKSTQESFVNENLKHSLFSYAVIEILRENREAGKTVSWTGLVYGVEEKFGSETFQKLMEGGRKQTPVERKTDLEATQLVAFAASPTDEKIEEYEWQGEKKKRTVRTIALGGEKVEFVKIPKGEFLMGSPTDDQNASVFEQPQHKVLFTKELWVAKYPITKGQFAAFVKSAKYETEAERDKEGGWGFDSVAGKLEGRKPKYNWKETGWETTDRHPVVNVSWNDADEYCKWASKESKKAIRVLNESEYEYANRAGSKTQYFTGDELESLKDYANNCDVAAKAKFPDWPCAKFNDGYAFTSPVGRFNPNGFGLHDMTGNVWSWCGDWFKSDLYKRGDVKDPKANEDGEQKSRVLRGGSWGINPWGCRSACRDGFSPSSRSFNFGFRVCFQTDAG
jgi:formylglycine-generating enzyme required for sulfatase activity